MAQGLFRAIDTDVIGDYLKKEYGEKDPNTHIVCFYIKLGQEIQWISSEEVIKKLHDVIGSQCWAKVEPSGNGLLIFEFNLNCENERERENKLEENVRQKLKAQLPTSSAHIMFSRACLYTESSKDDLTTIEIKTGKIGELMENVYSDPGVGNDHIEYFYLFIQAEINGQCFVKKKINEEEVNIHDMAMKKLKALPGEWRSVQPQETWLGAIFGFYPKEMRVLTEREREKRLNGEVRIPLRETLEDQLKPFIGRGGTNPTVHIILTRACKYTLEKMVVE